MKVVWSPRHAGHNPVYEIEHGAAVSTRECPERVDRIRAALAADPQRFEFAPIIDHGLGPIESVHEPGLVRFLEHAWTELHSVLGPEVVAETFLSPWVREGMGPMPDGHTATFQAQLGRWCWETNTPLVEHTYDAARSAVDVALTAADLVLGGERVAYGLCRPPGHHAPRAAYGGFCFFNNAAIVAHDLERRTGSRGDRARRGLPPRQRHAADLLCQGRCAVRVVARRPAPRLSVLQRFREETGVGRGHGANLNLPLPARLPDDGYLAALATALDAIRRFDPGVLVVSLGVDTYWNDPISDLGLTQDGFESAARLVGELGLPTVVLQEGGYDLDALGENVRRWLVGCASVLQGEQR